MERQQTAQTTPAPPQRSSTPAVQPASPQATSLPDFLEMQQTLGNQAVQRLYRSGVLQAKLKIGAPGDKYEQEADRVADQVMRMPEPIVRRQAAEEEEPVQAKPLAAQITPLVQRQPATEEEEPMQAKFEDSGEAQIQRQTEEEEETAQTVPLQRQPAAEKEEEQVQAKTITIQRQCPECEKEMAEEGGTVQRVIDMAQVPVIQRLCPECEEKLQRQAKAEEEESPIQTRLFNTPTIRLKRHAWSIQRKSANGQTAPASSHVEANISAMRGGGSPLSHSARNFFEPRFGADFSSVRVHTDSRAAEISRAINARAFTVGHDIAFGAGEYAPYIEQGKSLLAHELAHVIQQEGQALDLQRSPLSAEELANRAERLFNAFSGPGTDEEAILGTLDGLTPIDVAELERIYQQNHSPRRDGRNLVADLIYELEDIEDRHRALSLIRRGVERQEHPEGIGGSRPHIAVEPLVQEVVPGSEVTYVMDIGAAIFSTVRYQWFVRNDPRTRRGRPFLPEIVRGPAQARWEARWDSPGRHTVVCEVQFGEESPTYYEYIQVVREAPELAAESFEQRGVGLQPDLYVGLLELQKRRLEQQDATQNAEQIRQLEEAIQNARRLLEIPQTGAVDTPRGCMVLAQTEAGPGPARPMRAVLVPTARPEPVTLQLFVKPLADGRWAIVDLTDPDPGRARTYEGSPASGLQGQAAIRSAVQHAWEDFVEDNPHPAGQLVGEPPDGLGFERGTRWNVHTNGISSLEEVSQWFSRVGLIAGITAIALYLVPEPSSKVVATAILISAAAGATAATLNIIDRIEHGNFQWNTETALDLLDLAGSLAVGVGTALSLSGRALSITRLRSAVIISEGVDTGSDLASGVILSALHYSRIEEIRRRTDLTDAQKEQMIRTELEQASLQGGLILLGVVGGGRATRQAVEIDLPRVRDVLEQPGIVRELRDEVLDSPGLQWVLMDHDYDPAELNRLWGEWQSRRDLLESENFTQYVGRRGYRAGVTDNPTLSEVFGADFANLPVGEKNLRILGTTEPDLVQAIRSGSLPSGIQQRVNQLLNQDIIGDAFLLNSARDSISRQLSETLGRSVASIAEFQQVIELVRQPGRRGAIGEYFFTQHAAGSGTAGIRKPSFRADEIPGLTVETFTPDRIRPNSRRTLDVKVGYTATDIDVEQLRNYDRLVNESQRPGSRVQQTLQSEVGIAGGLTGHDYLFLPRSGENARDAAARAYESVRREGLLENVNIFYMDNDGVIWRFIGSQSPTQRIGTRLPD